ncbi:MAG: AbrB/MazE/SpoVT family DNA-binding domain-containing protein [Armatimonadetes bacterium]|nr:AbrB/MazE/SpoVT family DNA-binding domain-containing protein [Armatimonadota bacterium]
MLLTLRKNAQITIPASIRKRAHLEEGDLLEAEVRGDEIVLRPKKLIDKSQAWFWTKEWQEAERTADEDIKAGRVKAFESVEDLIDDLSGGKQ